MSETITLTMPDSMFQPLQRAAQATNQPVEEVLLTALQASLPSLEGLPPAAAQNLTELESLNDQALWRVMLETVPADKQRRLEKLLSLNQDGAISEMEREQLAELQREADLVMLRKARAAVLLRFRGNRIPTVAELNQLPPSEQIRLRQLIDQVGQEQRPPKPPLDKRMPPKPMPEGAYRSLRWVKEHARTYAGQWVALDGDRLIAHSPNHDEVWAAAKASGVRLPLITFVENPDKIFMGL